jgi:hypothetical protein
VKYQTTKIPFDIFALADIVVNLLLEMLGSKEQQKQLQERHMPTNCCKIITPRL